MRTKYIYRFLSLVFVLLFLTGVLETKAMNTGFATEDFTEEKKAQIMENIDITLFTTTPQKRGILCFDVNEKGMIAVYQEHSDNKEVCIYTSQGEFLYGYSIKTNGSIRVEWDNENINVLFVRGGILASVDPKGNILDLKEVPSTVENSIYLLDLESTYRKVGETKYRIRNDQGLILNVLTFSFSQIVVMDPDGTERIIYDINTEQLIKKILILILISICVTTVIVGIVREFKKAQHKNNGE